MKFDIQKEQSFGFFYIKLPIVLNLRYYLVKKYLFMLKAHSYLYYIFTSLQVLIQKQILFVLY